MSFSGINNRKCRVGGFKVQARVPGAPFLRRFCLCRKGGIPQTLSIPVLAFETCPGRSSQNRNLARKWVPHPFRSFIAERVGYLDPQSAPCSHRAQRNRGPTAGDCRSFPSRRAQWKNEENPLRPAQFVRYMPGPYHPLFEATPPPHPVEIIFIALSLSITYDLSII